MTYCRCNKIPKRNYLKDGLIWVQFWEILSVVVGRPSSVGGGLSHSEGRKQ